MCDHLSEKIGQRLRQRILGEPLVHVRYLAYAGCTAMLLVLSASCSSHAENFSSDAVRCYETQPLIEQMTSEMADWRDNQTLSSETSSALSKFRRQLHDEMDLAKTDNYRLILTDTTAWADEAIGAAANGARDSDAASPSELGVTAGRFSGTCERLANLANDTD